MSEVVVLIGASIGQAIARRISAGKHVVVGDLHRANAEAAADVMRNAGFDATTATVDVSSRESVHALVETVTMLGELTVDEVATLAALLLGADGAFITGSDFLMDGGVTASYFYGELAAR